MGYTHYFPHKSDFTDDQWNELLEDFKTISQKYGSFIQFEEDDDRPPVADQEMIRFNGIGDQGHETFFLEKRKPNNAIPVLNFRFCKTARKEYDLVVCLVLLTANRIAPFVLEISSDGTWEEDWQEAREAYEKLFDQKALCPWYLEC